MINTNWTTPKRNILAAMLDLRNALAAGKNARLIKIKNEDCAHPIKVKNSITDFRAYEFSVGQLRTRQSITDDNNMSEFEKHLSLNYKVCYGTKEAVEKYYNTGKLSKDNFKGIGMSHLVNVKDIIRFHASLPDKFNKEYAGMFRLMYLDDTTVDETHFFDMYTLKNKHSEYTIQKFKRKVWAIELLSDNKDKLKTPILIKILNIILYPLKYIPRRSVLKMDNYKVVTYRVGDVINGLAIDFHIPKKFSFSKRIIPKNNYNTSKTCRS